MRLTPLKDRRVKEIRVLWTVPPLVPASTCPHGVEIGRDRICVVCHAAEETTQEVIDKAPAPPPQDPEDRALRQAAYLRDWLRSHPDATTRMKCHVMRQVGRLEAIAKQWIPTKFSPGLLRGGKA